MKSVRVHEFGEPEVMRLEEMADLSPSANQVLVRVKAAGVNPVDAYIRAGQYARKPELPYTPGADAAGIVEKVGADVSGFKIGDRVYVAGTATGTYAEFCLSNENEVFALPERISFEQGAGVAVPYATAYRALFQKAAPQSGEFILIHGASGGVGIAAVQLARQADLKIIGTGGSEAGRDLIMNAGADYVLDHTEDDYLDELLKITDGRGVNIILEMLANVNLQKDLDALAMFGRIVVIGSRGSIEINPRSAMSKDAAIFGMSLFNAPPSEASEIHQAIGRGLSDGSLKPEIGAAFSFANAPQAHRAVMENKAGGKIILMSEPPASAGGRT